jgi:DNA polymerase-1
MEISWESSKYDGYDGQALQDVFRKLEFKSLLEKMDFTGGTGKSDGAVAADILTTEEELDCIVLDENSVVDFAAKLGQIQSLHVEVIGDNPHNAEVLGIAFAEEGKGYYLPLQVLESESAKPVRDWLADPQKLKTLFDVHRAQVALAWRGIVLEGCTFDVVLATYLLDPTESTQTLHALAANYGLPGVKDDAEVFGKGAKFKVPEIAALCRHLCQKAGAVRKLAAIQKKELEEKGMTRLYFDLELPLATVLADMERQGIQVNREELQEIGDELSLRIQDLIQEIYGYAGGEFNLNSPKQLGEVLFERLQLPVVKKTKTGPSTDAEVLERLRPKHEIVAHILDYRMLAKLQSTYIEGLLKEIRPDTHKIHTYFRQTIAATGRLSSQYPNLQNIPIRLEEGRKIRKAFVPSEEGWQILAADYSQIELRVLAHISKDERLMEAFHRNMDIHTKTAMDVFGVAEDQVDRNMRRSAKAVNFGIVYGISDYGLSQNLDITRAEAARFIEQYFAVFRGVRQYMDTIVQQARKDGYVTTLLHRRRYLPEINASNYNLRSFAERTAMNTPIQGTAADIIKLAMVQISERLAKDKLRSRMLLQVHDELVFEVPPEEMETMQHLVPEVMNNALPLNVPLKVDVEYGKNWYEAK